MHEKAGALQGAWDILIALSATIFALAVPIWLVFDIAPGPWLSALASLFSVVYAVDAALRFRRYRRPRQRSVGGFPVRRHDFSGIGLVFDVLAAVPVLPLLGTASPLLLLPLFKLYRVAAFMHAWGRHVRNANVYRLLFFIYWLFLATHWIACGWVNLRGDAGLVDDWSRYLRALYWCVTTLATVGYGDITPTNNAQMVYAIGVMIGGVGVYAFMIGNIATILTNIDPVRAGYLKQQERLTAFMHYRHLPLTLQHRIRDYYDYLWEKRLVYDESVILKDLPSGLSTEVSLFLKRDLIENVPLFKGARAEFIRDVALELQPVVCPAGDYVIRAGEVGRDMYFISRGTVEVLTPDGRTISSTLTDGDFFGEIALFLNQPRTANVRAVDYCDLYRLDKEMFGRVLSHYPDIAAQMESLARERYSTIMEGRETASAN